MAVLDPARGFNKVKLESPDLLEHNDVAEWLLTERPLMAQNQHLINVPSDTVSKRG